MYMYMYLNLVQARDSNSHQRMENFYYDFGLEIAFILFPERETDLYVVKVVLWKLFKVKGYNKATNSCLNLYLRMKEK